MAGPPIPAGESVVRHCRARELFLVSGTPTAVNASAFALRLNEDGLSVDRLEFFGGDRAHRLDCVRSITKLGVRRSYRMAVLGVDEVRGIELSPGVSANVEINLDPSRALPPNFNAAHALIGPVDPLQDIAVRELFSFIATLEDYA